MRRLLAALAVSIGALVLVADPVAAHPLGNFTVNTYSGLVVHPNSLEIRFVLDMAEIPAFQRKGEIDTDGDGRNSVAEQAAFRTKACDQIRQQLELRVDDKPSALTVRSTSLSFPPGQAGLATLRLTCSLTAGGDFTSPHQVSFTNANYVDRTGWREIAAVGDGVTLKGSNVATKTISAELTAYPEDLLQAPLDEQKAGFTVTPGGPRLAAGDGGTKGPSAPSPRGVDRATKAFTSFVARQHLTFGFALSAIALSALLGAIHAFAPGHGKTVMAAYLVGQEGSMRQAGLIALTVTLTHTAGVLILGVAISASAVITPERLYPYLGVASGAMLAAIGVGLLLRPWRLARKTAVSGAHTHDHAHDVDGQDAHGHDANGHAQEAQPHEAHDHEAHSHEARDDGHAHGVDGGHHDAPTAKHAHGGRSHTHGPIGADQNMTWGSMLAIGFVGGFLPSPSAVVVILGAIALNRAWFGVVLVLSYGVGMALTLTGAGLVLLKTRGALNRRYLTSARRSRLATFNRLLPTLTGVVIVLVGLVLAAQGLTKV